MRPRFVLLESLAPRKKPAAAWGVLAAPVNPIETQLRMRAQSIMSGPTLAIGRGFDADGKPEKTGQCPTLTLDQARDVLRWAGELHNFERGPRA